MRNCCDDLTQRKRSKIINQGPPAFARRGGVLLALAAPAQIEVPVRSLFAELVSEVHS